MKRLSERFAWFALEKKVCIPGEEFLLAFSFKLGYALP